jgi:hypothetical protein
MGGSHRSAPERGRRGKEEGRQGARLGARLQGGAMGVAARSSWLPHACSLYVACCCA